jgi:hypothetical protein
MFEQERIAREQRGHSAPKDLPERKIPRHDRQHDAERFEGNVGVRRSAGGTLGDEETRSVVRVIAAEERAFLDLGASLRERFAHLGGGERGEVVAPRHEFAGQCAELPRPLFRRQGAPWRLRLRGACDGLRDGAGAVRRVARETATGGGIDGDKTHDAEPCRGRR